MMTTLFRIVLILVSTATFAAVMHKIRHARMRIEDAVFWVLLCLMFVIFAVFPGIADRLAQLLGIYSTPNFLFLLMIFILVLKVFSLSMHLSALETKLRELTQEEALSALLEKERAESGTDRKETSEKIKAAEEIKKAAGEK